MAVKSKFHKLLEPGNIGAVRTKNRMVRMGAMPGCAPFEGGRLQDYYFDFYTGLAKGGVGLVTMSGHAVDAPKNRTRGYGFDDDKYVPRFHELTDKVHKYGCPIFMQLIGIGPWNPPPLTAAASSIPASEMPIMTQNFPDAHELTIPEIKDLIDRFVDRAERAKKAGFDGVEVNAACNHLLNTFVSRAWNRRHDEYGCDTIENRVRIVTEIIKKIREKCGKDFGIVVVINAAEPGLPNGITSKESQEMAKFFEAAGADAIQARVEFFMTHKADNARDSTHFPDAALYPEAPDYAAPAGVDVSHHGEGGWAPYAAAIKKVVKIPVIAVGRMSPELGEKMLEKGQIDFVNMNRRLIADHDLPNKVKEGRLEDIAPCTACMTCFNCNERGEVITCRVNSAMGRESEYEIKPAAKKKKVAIIGSGPSGLEAARVAALRGHDVTLFEKEPMLGGAVNLAAVVKGIEREDLVSFIEYFKRQVTKAGVDIRTGKEADRETIATLKPDVVIVATGGAHHIPKIPGIDRKNVMTSENLHHQLKNYLKITGTKMMVKLASKYVPVGKKVVIMGGGIQGCETAEFLVKHGKNVTIVEEGPEIGEGLLKWLIKPQLLDYLNRKGVRMIAGARFEEITDKGLIITTKEGNKETLEADTVLTAMPLDPDHRLFQSLKGVAPEVYEIGDGKEQGMIVDAVADGAAVAHAI